ncbi:MAG: flagellar hook-associated protein FlgK [Alphaproteobacteria bacterium]|jgi:flagellar hook-associated protein 1|nr:flagellar hook-associated protein FlgK [Alphaproteobacteria bacterium]MBT7942467.1 flagellar hook-associated protein FlgK [Alphaproteobacteria bacterium]
MASITQALRTAQSGLLVNQETLNVVANNIANVNTEGYSRKIIKTESQVIVGVGAGVKISDISRNVDEGLLKSIRIELGELNALTIKDNYLSRTQDIFGSPEDNSSISHIMDEFVLALESLSLSPEKSVQQSEVIRRANDIVRQFQDISTTIQELRLQADVEIGEKVTDMNTIVARIDQLNDDIITNSTAGRDVSDLRDQRDSQIDLLSTYIDVRYFYRSDGDVVVFSSGGRTLVDTIPPTITHTAAASVSSTSTHDEGDIAGIYVGNVEARNDITDELRGGQLKGLVELRDQTLPNLQAQLDELAAEMRDAFNQIHNRGVAFPGAQDYTGSKTFVRPTEQTLAFSGNSDTTVTLFDSNGNQTAQTTMRTLIGGASSTISNSASVLQTWLRANGAATATAVVDSSGKFDIDLNTTLVNLAFRDETATTNGSTHQDATINFDANGDAVTDETISGFANFLGLNDFFVDNLAENIYQSNVLVSSFATSASALTFRDSSGTLTGSPLTVAAGLSMTDLATLITNGVTNVTASVITDGSGVRLRVAHDNGASMTVTQASTNTFLTDIGMKQADTRVASTMTVRTDIANQPSKISTGAVLWDAAKGSAGEYFMSTGDNAVIEALSAAFSTSNTFDTAGGLATARLTFSEYTTSIVSENARETDTNKVAGERQRSLSETLQLKSDSTRGVNLDEEMSNLIIFEQAFNASARVIAVIQRMLDALEQAI